MQKTNRNRCELGHDTSNTRGPATQNPKHAKTGLGHFAAEYDVQTYVAMTHFLLQPTSQVSITVRSGSVVRYRSPTPKCTENGLLKCGR
jgi:hypothetical protein